ncbi:HEAT repeat domain-containing protein [Leptonema illini]|uniref:PBS lyase HEAT domain protein repeat-containing protein n=1 Tax=Leptonema illini DSM 21528 TaxID=929563 RepID=H2CAR3_9LEPT|nr:HEAT repeat domain-containing protein [Leptonema illini]EHQ08441.1 PBS lyase HEAT domain protein repeat-containing protein [Leptonema illini DSM 21528]
MRRLILVVALLALAAPTLDAAGDDPARLIYMMEKGGLERRQAFWFAYQSKQYFLLRRAVRYLLESDDYEDHRMILRVMEVLGPSLDTHIPGWYDILDRYMTPSVPDDLLVRCMKLSVQFKEHRMVFAVTRMMEHPIYAVRLEAIRSLVAMENDNVVPVLIRYMKSDDPVLLIYGLQGARVLGDSRFLPFIRDLLEHRNKSVRIYALRAVSESRGEGDLSYLITGRFSRENNAEVRRTIVQLIGERMMGGQQYTVTRAMQDSSALVREAAYNTAVHLRSALFARELSLRLTQEDDVRLKGVVIDALTRLNMGDPLSGLSRIARSDVDPTLRSLAVRAIGRIKDRTQNDALFQVATTDTDASVRREAAQSLALLADLSQGQRLASAVENNDLDTEVRFLLFRALVKSGNREAVRQLKERARHIKDPVLRSAVENDA